MQLSTMELLIVSVGLSIDVFVAAAYMGAGFSKIRWKNLVLLKRSVWRYSAWGTGTWKPDHIAAVTVYYQNEDGG